MSPSGAAKGVSSGAKNSKRQSCTPGEDVRPFLGNYHVMSLDNMTGGITSELNARSKSSAPVVLSKGLYKSGWLDNGIVKPRYVISCYPVVSGGGEVPSIKWNAHWTNFYGFETGRGVIKVLEVHNPADKDASPYTWFEVVNVDGNEQLWQQHDGWLLRMVKVR